VIHSEGYGTSSSGKCRETCDTSSEYTSGMYHFQCTAKKNAGGSCDHDGQCLSGSCKGNRCCSDTAIAQGCSICTSGNGTCSTLKMAGESCTSDSDCYAQDYWNRPMCAGGVCCTSTRLTEGMGNCSKCGSYTDMMGQNLIDCVECPTGFQVIHSEGYGTSSSGKCRETCDTSSEYTSGMYHFQCTAKKNAGGSCDHDGQCLSGSCKGNRCCSDTAIAQGCSICTSGNGTCSTLKMAGESCTSDSDCYAQDYWNRPMCAGGVCCTSTRLTEGMGNCSKCGSYTDNMGSNLIDCVECPTGFQVVHSEGYGT
jgi:hypothetical protein